MNGYRNTAAVLVFVLVMAITVPAWALGGAVTSEIVIAEPANYSLEISAGSAQTFAAECGVCSVGDDIVVTNSGNRGVFLNMVAEGLPTNAAGTTLTFGVDGYPGANELSWAIRQHMEVDSLPVFINTTAQQISLGAMAPTEVLTFHSNAKTGTQITTPGAYNWAATIIATDENGPQ
ncbi:MAG: hypothetical protein Q7W30_09195 [Coriobacteriia bacterium]|nr:hypothetical protein [Coriobacteriia bacterium]